MYGQHYVTSRNAMLLLLTFNVLFLWILKTNSHKKHKHCTINQFSMRFALLARCLISSFTCRFLFFSLESVVKSNVMYSFFIVHQNKNNHPYSFGRSVYARTVQ